MKVMVIMARLTRFAMVLGTVLGLNSVAPAPVQAGVIPWMYDAIFGPVGSIRANRVAYGTNYGSGYGMAYSAYGPTTVAYAPVSMASYGGSVGGSGCSTCNQSANYAPAYAYDSYYGGPSYSGYGLAQSYVGTGCSTCNSCGTGGYAGGSTCSNCAVNPIAPAPSTSTYYGGTPTGSPTPDTSNVLQRLNQLELHQKEIDRKLKLEHNSGGAANDPYLNNNDAFTNSTRRPGTPPEDPVPVPARRKTFESGPADETFTQPLHKRGPGTAPFNDESIETKKPDLDLTPPVTIPDPKPAETEPQAYRLESRVTTRAIAPRDRMPVTKKPASTIKMSQSNKKATTSWLDSSLTSDVVRN